ncbi:DUF6850 family outer membrane beta-barrel protein [Sphingobacterium suaedae]|uniref:DUF6850 family outer membrane beta-barrel protein n=1 Tax=Sphingobacterium suaedae TaxID=1686402 RepID=A0ABW5KNI9_9SPHI
MYLTLRTTILVGLILSTMFVRAQDTVLHDPAPYQLERISNMNDLRIQGTAIGALQPYRWLFSGTDVEVGYGVSEQKLYDWQKGAGKSEFGITASSYLRELLPNTTVWGNAQYVSSEIKKVNYNESLDYDRILPYALADSVGGDLKQESYTFGGGLARTYEKWTLAGEVAVVAQQAYRQLDPRPNNRSSTLTVELSGARELAWPYTVALAVEGELYKQTAQLSFANQLGIPLIFNLNGLGNYNNLLTGSGGGSSTSVHYHANKLGVSLQFIPKRKGLWIGGSVARDAGSKSSGRSFDDINNWTDLTSQVTFGFDGNWGLVNYSFLLRSDVRRREGSEGLFTNQNTDSELLKIAELSSYRLFEDRFGGSLTLGQQYWNVKIGAAYRNYKEQYLSPYRSQDVQQIDAHLDLQYFIRAKGQLIRLDVGMMKTSNFAANHTFHNVKSTSGIAQLLANNFEVLSREPLFLTGQAQWHLPILSQWKPYITAKTQHASSLGLHVGELKLGFVF